MLSKPIMKDKWDKISSPRGQVPHSSCESLSSCYGCRFQSARRGKELDKTEESKRWKTVAGHAYFGARLNTVSSDLENMNQDNVWKGWPLCGKLAGSAQISLIHYEQFYLTAKAT